MLFEGPVAGYVSTFVFYQALAYGGTDVADVLAAMERGEHDVTDRVLGISRTLGGIEILVRIDGGPLHSVGHFSEAGPIAADRQLFDLGTLEHGSVEVTLRMARGSWRLDEVALAHVSEPVEPVVLDPVRVEAMAPGSDDGLARLLDPDVHLVTARGDARRIWFEVPPGAHHRLFLDTQGYYYEWMRGEWLEEQSALSAATVLENPAEALRRMAPRFKAVQTGWKHSSGPAAFGGRTMKRLGRIALLVTLLAVGAVPAVAQDAVSVPIPVTGRDINLVLTDGERLSGELIDADAHRLLLWGSSGLREIDYARLTEVEARRHGFGSGRALAWVGLGALVTGVGMTAACSQVDGTSCGGVFLGMTLSWAVIGGLFAGSVASGQYQSVPMDPTALRPLARFPQGAASRFVETNRSVPRPPR